MQYVASDTLKTEHTHGTHPPPPQVPQENSGDTNPNLQNGRTAISVQQARRTRHRFMRYHWRTAKQLSHSISENEMAAWLITEIASSSLRDKTARIERLVELRHMMASRHNQIAMLRLSAAIFKEVKFIKNIRKTKKNSQNVEFIRPNPGEGKNSNVPGRIFKVESPAGGPTCSR